MKKEIKIFYSKDWEDYELLDTGDGEKLEKFGKYIFIRPYEDAVWKKSLSKKEWEKGDGKFWSSQKGAKAGWKMNHKIESKWQMSYKNIAFLASPTPFRHLGFFPEQVSHWDFIETRLRQGFGGQRKIKFLNLFGYTGVASLFALRAGADVTHVDASKTSISWAKENEKVSGLFGLRVFPDDVMKFLERQIKKGEKYDAVIMDPPKFGRGPKGEVWKLEENLSELLENVRKVLSEKPLFVILTSYATDASPLTLGYALEEMMQDFNGEVEAGELCIQEKSKNRPIPLANTAIWQAK